MYGAVGMSGIGFYGRLMIRLVLHEEVVKTDSEVKKFYRAKMQI